MNGTSTIRIPADMTLLIEAIPSPEFINRAPLHVAKVSDENPDEFGMAFYAFDQEWTDGINHRASMIARASDDNNLPEFIGDILLQCDEKLAALIVENDNRFRGEDEIITAFRSWLQDYATAHDLDNESVFRSVVEYAAHVISDSRAKAEADMQGAIASALGLSPDQIGILVL